MIQNEPFLFPKHRNATISASSVSVSTSATNIMSSNYLRTWFMFQNQGTANVRITLGSFYSANSSFILTPNTWFIGDNKLNYTGDATAISVSGTNTILVMSASPVSWY